ncbi:hypothetical protein FHX49_002390 [Microbacterium endophyticum]|uniref:Uncharacterized protein n=1 Tax=Microbacterium endophyticum TaxID=1526412 RepID=A0A7W4V5C0_9MICO|nr:hypothetical protein [Microbacterium endophyticum]NIK36559.1 hypothetical protein [Microbacterium endophyticum]
MKKHNKIGEVVCPHALNDQHTRPVRSVVKPQR